MTPQERKAVVELITETIREQGPLPLGSVRNLLVSKLNMTIPSVGPKKWLDGEFPEFFVCGTYGHELVDFASSPLSRFYKRLIQLVPGKQAGTPVSYETVTELARSVGLTQERYHTVAAAREMIKLYPNYELIERAASLADTDPAAGERQYVQAVSYMDWEQASGEILKHCTGLSADEDQVSYRLAHTIAKALLCGEGIYTDAMGDEISRLVFATDFETDKKQRLYCVLRTNTKPLRRQSWMLEGIVYPGQRDEEGLGSWLEERLFGKTDVTFAALQKQIRELAVLRQELLPCVNQLLTALQKGVCPDAVSRQIGEYERRWSALKAGMDQFPSLDAGESMDLAQLETLLDEKDELADMARNAVSLFDGVYDGAVKNLAVLQATPPETDRKTVHSLFDRGNIQKDIQVFRETLRPYECLLEVLQNTDRNQVVESCNVIAEHFDLDKLDIVEFLLGQYSTKYAFLDALSVIDTTLEQCGRMAVEKAESVSMAVDADELAEELLAGDFTASGRWLQLQHALMPADMQLAAVVLGESVPEELSGSLTLGAVADRLLAVCGNQDRLAEKYMLLGLCTDREACVMRLLKLYRENDDAQRFLKIWNSSCRNVYFTDQDACYWMSLQNRAEAVNWEAVETLLTIRPALKKSEDYQAALRVCTQQDTQRCGAYFKWLGLNSVALNPLEQAVADKDTGAAEALLQDPQQMTDMGYGEEEVLRIRQVLAEGLPGGVNAYARARRLYCVQKNKNGAAESVLWAAPLSELGRELLFEIYDEDQDAASLCWLMDKYQVPLDTNAQKTAYGLALSRTQQYEALEQLLQGNPQLWHQYALLQGLEGEPWQEICQRETANPMQPLNPFAQALIDFDEPAMAALLADPAQMAQWGYTDEMVRSLREKLAQAEAPSGTEAVFVAKRFMYYQGNLNRNLENYLYGQLEIKEKNMWATQRLFALAFSEGRYVDASAYYENNPVLARAEDNISKYLWCLLHLGKAQQLFALAQQYPASLRMDNELVAAVLEFAKQNDMQQETADIQRMLDLLPRDDFEKVVMQANIPEMQRYVSSPDLLTDMGYSPESIARFKDRIAKPIPSGLEGYHLGFRMRLFFGNQRAIPFMEDVKEDPRAAKELLNIYYAAQNWDAVCALYRENQDKEVWNFTHTQRYLDALSQSRSKENCQLYLEYLTGDRNPDKNSGAYLWKYVRCLIGTGRQEEALQQLPGLLEAPFTGMADVPADLFDMVWETGDEELRRQLALLVGRLYIKYMDDMPLTDQKVLLSLNGNLLQETDSGSWIELFNSNALETVSTFLQCYFNYGISDDLDSLKNKADSLLARLDDPDGTGKSNILIAVTQFALDNGLLNDPESETGKRILSHWLQMLLEWDPETGLPELEQLTHTEFAVFYEFWKTVQLTQEQESSIFAACLSSLETGSGWSSAFFLRINVVLGKIRKDSDLATQCINQLLAVFTQWFTAVPDGDSAAAKAAAVFLRDAQMDYVQMKAFLENSTECQLLYDAVVRKAVLNRCAEKWPDLQFAYLQKLYFYMDEQADQQNILGQAQQLLSSQNIEIGTDDLSLQFAYKVVCGNPTDASIRLLSQAYANAGKEEQAQLTADLVEVNNGETEAVQAWFHNLLERHPEEWLIQNSRWWMPLISLRTSDHQVKNIVSYLTADDQSKQYTGSVLRLLLSDLCNVSYISAYLCLVPELSSLAEAKLLNIRAAYDPSTAINAVERCIQNQQPGYAISLLLRKVEPVPVNAVFIGRNLGKIYTDEAVANCPELTQLVPQVFRFVIRLNQADPEGAWKNIGRAVDIAIATRQEEQFFAIFNGEYQNMYFSYAGKCAVLISNLMLRGEFDQAARYLQEHRENSGTDPYLYVAMLGAMIEECRQTGQLSAVNAYVLRTIPRDGNMRPLEMYGQLVSEAMEKDCLDICAQAFFKIRRFAPQDKALLASCLQLYTLVEQEVSLVQLYDLVVEYMAVAQENYTLRVSGALAVVTACAGDEVDQTQLSEICGARISDTDHLANIDNLRNQCAEFLNGVGSRAVKQQFLLRAATGWWVMDKNTLRYLTTEKHRDMCRKLMEIYPSSFVSACVAGVLQHREDAQICQDILAQLKLQDYRWAVEQLGAVNTYPEALCRQVAFMTNAPIDLPGYFNTCLDQAFAQTDDQNFIRMLNLLLVVQRNYLTKQYETNICDLKTRSAEAGEDREQLVSQLVLKKTISSSTNVLTPQQYLDIGEYESVIIAAEKMLANPKTQNSTALKRMNEMYIELGRFMTASTASRKYTLGELIDMTTLLCQSGSYADAEKLLEVCPAKWKLCLRSAQEFVQGDPRNVLKLMHKPAFQDHDGCYKYLYTLGRQYLSKYAEMWLREMRRERRGFDWTAEDLASVPQPATSYAVKVLHAHHHKYVKELDSYDAFIETYLAEMEETDLRNERGVNRAVEGQRNEPAVQVEQAELIWKVSFVAAALDKFDVNKSGEAGQPEWVLQRKNNSREDESTQKLCQERKETLQQQLKDSTSDEEKIAIYEELLALVQPEPVTTKTRQWCVQLGYALYKKNCEWVGMARRATEEARNILYSMAPCFESGHQMLEQKSALKVYLPECLESYRDLRQLTADCGAEMILKLCAVTAEADRGFASCLKKYVLFVRDIGQKLRAPQSNAQRLEWLQSRVTACRTMENVGGQGPKQTLIDMLSKEIMAFRNKAQIHLDVYNESSDREKCSIFGSVKNLGNEPVTNLVLQLMIDDGFKEQYSLPVLEGSEMVPFCLSCGQQQNQKLSYKVTLKYTTQDGVEESAQPEEGMLTLTDNQDPYMYQVYDASNPADSENYVERASISRVLEGKYLVDGGFRRFPNCAIYGMKRSGKSSVLRRLGRLLDDNYPDSVRHVIVSCEGAMGDFYTRVHAVLVKAVLKMLTRKFRLNRKEGWSAFCKQWEQLPQDMEDFGWLDDFYYALGQDWLPDAGLVVIVDEIERLYFDLNESGGSDKTGGAVAQSVEASHIQNVLWDVINKMTQQDDSLIRFVLCGSDFFTAKLIAEGDHLTQFFQKGVKLNVDRMEHEEIREALNANTTVTIHESAESYLWDIAAGLPWHSKVFCNCVIDNQLISEESSKRNVIYPSDIQNAVDYILSTTKDITSPANFGLMSLNVEENLIIQTLARMLETRLAKLHQDDLMEQLMPAEQEEAKRELFEKALRSLVNERKLLKMDKSHNYQFACELYRMYLRREVPSRFLA